MQSNHTQSLIRLIVAALNSNIVEILGVIFKYGSRVWSQRIHEGIYEVLDYQSVLELKDSKGHTAVLTKRQKVKYLQNSIIAYQDKAWGDGDFMAEYKVSPGIPVDKYREGHTFKILISLQGTKNRGDKDEFHIERTIRDGFVKEVEDFQTDIDHTTRRLSLSAIFPKKRLPKKVVIIEQNTKHAIVLGDEHRHLLPDGRLQVTWLNEKPKLFEAYILRWEW